MVVVGGKQFALEFRFIAKQIDKVVSVGKDSQSSRQIESFGRRMLRMSAASTRDIVIMAACQSLSTERDGGGGSGTLLLQDDQWTLEPVCNTTTATHQSISCRTLNCHWFFRLETILIE